MKKYLKIPTTGDKGTVYLNILKVIYAKPNTATTTILRGAPVLGSPDRPVTITLTHAAETDNATTRWWCDNVKRIIDAPYEEVVFEATTPPFAISDITFS